MKRVLVGLLRLGLAGVFVYAGTLKLRDPATFAGEIEAYRLVSIGIAQWIGVGLPWFEVVVGIAILLPTTTRAAALWQAVMMVGFIAALTSAWWRGLDITCGCFGGQKQADYVELLVRDILLLVAALLVFWQYRAPRSVDHENRGFGAAASSEAQLPDGC